MVLFQLINSISETEQQQCVGFLKEKNRRGDVKNIQLFKLICKGETEDLDQKIYGKSSKNAFYGLCNRLQESIIDFLATQSFSGETSEELDCLKKLLASRILFERQLSKLAFKTLIKAESLALQFSLYPILNEIYHTKIQYAHLQDKESLDSITAAAKINLEKFGQEFQLNMAYAKIKEALQNDPFQNSKILIDTTFKQFNISPKESLTFKSVYQLLSLLNISARQQSNYYNLIEYAESLYDIVQLKADKASKNIYYHIEILLYLATIHFRNKNFETSLQLLQNIDKNIEVVTAVLKWNEELVLLKALNLNYTGNYKKAVTLLTKTELDSFKLKLVNITILFQQQKFTEAYQLFKDFYHSDIWYEKKLDVFWVIKKNIIEILLLIELDKVDLVYNRIKAFQKKFSKTLKSLDEERVISYIKLVKLYYDKPNQVTSSDFNNKVEASFEWKNPQEEDIFVMSFYAWLKSKMNKSNLYETTLHLVTKKHHSK